MIIKKTKPQIEAMRKAGRALAEVHKELAKRVKPGASLKDLDKFADRSIRLRGGTPSFLGYKGFPKSICASPNEVIVHGIPNGRTLQSGDLISLDIGLIIDGWHADRAVTFAVGECSAEDLKLVETTKKSLAAAIAECQVGRRLGDIGWAVQQVVEGAGFTCVAEYSGHGIGRALHEDPAVLNYGSRGKGTRLEPGMVLAIEPMVNAGGPDTKVLKDGWTVVTADGSKSAHFEHTVVITEDGPEVLTSTSALLRD